MFIFSDRNASTHSEHLFGRRADGRVRRHFRRYVRLHCIACVCVSHRCSLLFSSLLSYYVFVIYDLSLPARFQSMHLIRIRLFDCRCLLSSVRLHFCISATVCISAFPYRHLVSSPLAPLASHFLLSFFYLYFLLSFSSPSSTFTI